MRTLRGRRPRRLGRSRHATHRWQVAARCSKAGAIFWPNGLPPGRGDLRGASSDLPQARADHPKPVHPLRTRPLLSTTVYNRIPPLAQIRHFGERLRPSGSETHCPGNLPVNSRAQDRSLAGKTAMGGTSVPAESEEAGTEGTEGQGFKCSGLVHRDRC